MIVLKLSRKKLRFKNIENAKQKEFDETNILAEKIKETGYINDKILEENSALKAYLENKNLSKKKNVVSLKRKLQCRRH